MSEPSKLRSFVLDQWHVASSGWVDLHDPVSEKVIACASSAGVDFGAALTHARERGGPALRAMTLAERGSMLRGVSKALRAVRDELIECSIRNTGTPVADARFDIDGAVGTLAYYGSLARKLEGRLLGDGEGLALAETDAFWGSHVRLPLQGAAVHINAFNFPAWGLAEKAACAWLAGMPVISKPATSTAFVTERCAEALVASNLLPEGAFQLICGSTGDLLSRLGAQDVFAFTGSAGTALALRRGENLLARNTRVNIEADSLNAAVLAPDVAEGSETFGLFVRDVAREMRQKTGQKCTAVRRVFVPQERMDAVEAALCAALERIVTGDPRDATVRMGPLATAAQLRDAEAGVAKLTRESRLVHGTGARIDGVGATPGVGYFFGPTLLRAEDAEATQVVHEHEVFGPVATLLGYDGLADGAARLVARAEGTLVTSIYSDDAAWAESFLHAGGAYTGRVYLGSADAQGMGSGLALPQSQHGGPGRAGGGSELGGLRGLELYTQRVALQGSRAMIGQLAF
ncbi:MAG: 3,4-dehydroadipyl-CoA semialdehyde dehydrogenase [Planctomycetota bacterium]|jgi:oxepin-CoA hydrolase/3-oxo-5,6-dehydrosuberyl-CoA semialdehyde dehydrogenase